MTTEQSIFDYQLPTVPEARERRDDGMARVEANAEPDWKAMAREIVSEYRSGQTFLMEDVRAELERRGAAVHDRRALGPVIIGCAKDGLVEKAGFAVAKTSNLSPKVLWRRR